MKEILFPSSQYKRTETTVIQTIFQGTAVIKLHWSPVLNADGYATDVKIESHEILGTDEQKQAIDLESLFQSIEQGTQLTNEYHISIFSQIKKDDLNLIFNLDSLDLKQDSEGRSYVITDKATGSKSKVILSQDSEDPDFTDTINLVIDEDDEASAFTESQAEIINTYLEWNKANTPDTFDLKTINQLNQSDETQEIINEFYADESMTIQELIEKLEEQPEFSE